MTHYYHKQNGLVLFIALIALVMMSIAAVALIRSVDTNTLITGNLSFRQTATISSSYGIESVADYLGPKALDFGDTTKANEGYHSTCQTFDRDNSATLGLRRCNGWKLTLSETWQAGNSRLAQGVGITAGKDAYGNTIEYIIERMCPAAGPATTACLFATIKINGQSNGFCNQPTCPPLTVDQVPIYRVTVRITGPRNSVSYVQTFIS